MPATAKYPQIELFEKITRHDNLPPEAELLGSIQDKLNYNDLYLFLKLHEKLVIVTASGPEISGSKHYIIGQFEAPLGMLSWFANALSDFSRTPAEGGLPAGAMSSADQDVEGEMLCIQRAMDAGNHQQGYIIRNRSRPDRFVLSLGDYDSSLIIFPDNFLFEGGLLKLFQNLGEKYEQGTL